jgi:hypothetical protein
MRWSDAPASNRIYVETQMGENYKMIFLYIKRINSLEAPTFDS